MISENTEDQVRCLLQGEGGPTTIDDTVRLCATRVRLPRGLFAHAAKKNGKRELVAALRPVEGDNVLLMSYAVLKIILSHFELQWNDAEPATEN